MKKKNNSQRDPLFLLDQWLEEIEGKQKSKEIVTSALQLISHLDPTSQVGCWEKNENRWQLLWQNNWQGKQPLPAKNKKAKLFKKEFLFSSFLAQIVSPEAFSTEQSHFIGVLEKILSLKLHSCPPSSRSSSSALSRDKLRFAYQEILGQSPSLLEVLSKLDLAIPSNTNILIEGESGTGKELIARAIHQYSNRKDHPFVSENCAAVAETLLESELFGHVKGSFTGAYRDKKGLFELADKGTIFLDEVGDMSLKMQSKLLRTAQSGEVRQVGGKKIKNVDVRIVAATNKNLLEEVRKKNFREDLYYRLNVVNIKLPPLRERGEDIILLAKHLGRKITQEMGGEPKQLTAQAQRALLEYSWPGNIRELENEMKRAYALTEGEQITQEDFSPQLWQRDKTSK